MLLFLKVLLTSATESVIIQSSIISGALMQASVLLASKRAYKAFVCVSVYGVKVV